jgi:hypothetical protein
MSLFPTPPAPVEPPSIRVLIIPLLIGAAIFLADTMIWRLAGVTMRAPVGLIAGGSIALGGVVGWLWRRALARASAAQAGS